MSAPTTIPGNVAALLEAGGGRGGQSFRREEVVYLSGYDCPMVTEHPLVQRLVSNAQDAFGCERVVAARDHLALPIGGERT